MVDAVVPRMDWSPLSSLFKTYQDAYDTAQAPQLYATLFGLNQPPQQPSLADVLRQAHERTGGNPLDRPPPPPSTVRPPMGGMPPVENAPQFGPTGRPTTPSGRPAYNGNYMTDVVAAVPEGEGPNQGTNIASDFAARYTDPNSGAPLAPPPARVAQASPSGTKAGEGLTVINSPVTAGMPPNIRAALPAMFANPKTQAMAVQLASKYINPEQYELLKDGIGNVYSRNKQTNETKPVFNVSSGIQEAAASGGLTPLEYDIRKQFGAAAADNTKLTPEQKVARESRSPTQQYLQDQDEYKARLEGDKTALKTFAEKHIAGQSAVPILDQMISLANKTPGGWAGAVSPTVARAVSALGVPVTPGMSNAELFGSLNRQLIPSIRDPGSTANYEQQLYMEALPALNQSPEGRVKIANMLKAQVERNAEIYKAYRQNIGKADLPEKLAAIRAKPMFSPEELKTLEATVGPKAGQGGGPVRVNTPDEARKLKPGTVFVTPDGRTLTR